MNGTHELTILRGAIWLTIIYMPLEPVSLLARIYEEIDLHESPKKPSHLLGIMFLSPQNVMHSPRNSCVGG